MGGERVEGRQHSGSVPRVWSGLLFGLGFSISLVSVAGLALFMSYRLSRSHETDESPRATWHKTFTPEAGLTVLSHEPKRSAHNLKVLGVVENKGKETWDLVRVEVNLFNAKEAFVGQCGSHASGPIRPGDQRYFVVDCRGSEADPIPEYTRYTVEVVNASYQADGGT
jgi:hypothetical protein